MKQKLTFLLILIVFIFPFVTHGAFITTACPAGSKNCISVQYFCDGKSYTNKSEYEICLENQKNEKEKLAQEELERIEKENKEKAKLEEIEKKEEDEKLNQKIQEMIESELEKERLRIQEEQILKIKQSEELVEIKPVTTIQAKPIILNPPKQEVPGPEENILKEEIKESEEITEESVAQDNVIIEKESLPVRVFKNVKSFISRIFGF